MNDDAINHDSIQESVANEQSAESVVNDATNVNATSAPYVATASDIPSSSKLPPEVVARFTDVHARLTKEIGKVFVGQSELALGSLIALFSSGHVLLESVPGLGKTLFASALGKALGCQFGRVQFTPDLMPSDVIGSPIFNVKTQEFTFHRGPIFTQILLVDEINRSPAKTHAALLEAMQENAATVDGVTYALPEPFFVIATQNPIESEGVYNLPEAQIDRFMFKIVATYPIKEDELIVLRNYGKNIASAQKLQNVAPVLDATQILELRQIINDVYVAPQLFDYVINLVRATREFPRLAYGASTRAALALIQGIRALALFQGRAYATPDDVARIALPTLRHRVRISPEMEIAGRSVDEILAFLIRSIEVPRM